MIASVKLKMDRRLSTRTSRRLYYVVARLVAVAMAVSYYFPVAWAFSGNVLTSIGVSFCNHCLHAKNNYYDSTAAEQRERSPEQIRRIRRRRQLNLEHWGVEYQHESPAFPSTYEEVADEVFHAISGTLCGLQRPDPNFASNAMHKSVLDYRPTQPRASSKRHWEDEDNAGIMKKQSKKNEKDIPARMGIEIDGAAYLSNQPNDEGRAMRILSLQIAQRLCMPWDDVESSSTVKHRSVAVYYNSLEQSLLASRQLSRWKSKEENNSQRDSLNHISIHCLGHDSLPPSMIKRKGVKSLNKRKTQQQTGERIILIVKPTDYDTDSRMSIHKDTHSPASDEHHPKIQANVVGKLQSLLFQAAASSIPAVVMSPRLDSLSPLQAMTQPYKRTGPDGFEQSGFQKSSTYGGTEPPTGPTSWLLRDIVPPVYAWAGCANILGQPKRSYRSIAALFHRQQSGAEMVDDETNIYGHADKETYAYYSRVALTQSTMETGHFWHMFAVKESLNPLHSKSAYGSPQSRATRLECTDRGISYHYIGSSHASRGRPSSRIMNDLFGEFCDTH